MGTSVRVRFAPSPTGYLHVGGARTALYCYLHAKKNNGQFILRIEDTDTERSTEESLKMQIQDLLWLGLRWDEGPDPKTLEDQGSYGPYRQSQRLDIYKKYAQKLLEEGKAYYCFLTDEELEEQRAAAKAANRPFRVESPFRDWPLEKALKEVESGRAAVVRFKVPLQNKDYVFQDIVRGEVRLPSHMIGDFVLLRSNGMPVYNFCCAIDDALMKITHV
ncbi:MAG: glutamate--tRNA ligase, partial [Bdellovibrio sp.]